MDQELPKDKLIEGKTVLIQVQKSYLPGVDAYKAHVFHRQVIGFDQLVNLAHQRNGSLDVATLRGAFRMSMLCKMALTSISNSAAPCSLLSEPSTIP